MKKIAISLLRSVGIVLFILFVLDPILFAFIGGRNMDNPIAGFIFLIVVFVSLIAMVYISKKNMFPRLRKIIFILAMFSTLIVLISTIMVFFIL